MKKVVEGRQKAIGASRQGPKLSSLFFADDLLIFFEASIDQLRHIKEGLDASANVQVRK